MSATLEEALKFEAKEAAFQLEDMMAEMLNNVEEGGGYIRRELDEFTVRQMLLARKYLMEEVEKLKEMKRAVVAEWDRRIKSKKKDIQNIDQLVNEFIREQNQGKPLPLDISTASLKKVPHKIEVKDELRLRQYLQERGQLKSFLKPAPLDATLAKNSILKEFERQVEEEAEKQIQEEIAASEKGKITQKRKKEIKEETLRRLSKSFQESLPEGLEYIPPTETLSIRYHI